MTVFGGAGISSPALAQILSTREAFGLGETADSLRHSCRTGALVRLRRGFYVSGADWAMADTVGRHVLRARAELRAQDGAVALCGVTSAAFRGLDLHDQDLSVVHLLRLDGGAAHRTSNVAHHRVLRPGDVEVEVVDGVPTVSVAQAVWEVACRSTLEGGVVTADCALHRKLMSGDDLRALVERFAFVPGSARGRMALRLARAGAESAGESVTRVQFVRFGLPEPELQYKVRDGSGRVFARLDFWWEDVRRAGEFDGEIKYRRLLKVGDTTAKALVREKKREDAVRAAAMCGMSRFIWSEVMPASARRTMAELAQAYERSRRLYVPGAELVG